MHPADRRRTYRSIVRRHLSIAKAADRVAAIGEPMTTEMMTHNISQPRRPGRWLAAMTTVSLAAAMALPTPVAAAQAAGRGPAALQSASAVAVGGAAHSVRGERVGGASSSLVPAGRDGDVNRRALAATASRPQHSAGPFIGVRPVSSRATDRIVDLVGAWRRSLVSERCVDLTPARMEVPAAFSHSQQASVSLPRGLESSSRHGVQSSSVTVRLRACQRYRVVFREPLPATLVSGVVLRSLGTSRVPQPFLVRVTRVVQAHGLIMVDGVQGPLRDLPAGMSRRLARAEIPSASALDEEMHAAIARYLRRHHGWWAPGIRVVPFSKVPRSVRAKLFHHGGARARRAAAGTAISSSDCVSTPPNLNGWFFEWNNVHFPVNNLLGAINASGWVYWGGPSINVSQFNAAALGSRSPFITLDLTQTLDFTLYFYYDPGTGNGQTVYSVNQAWPIGVPIPVAEEPVGETGLVAELTVQPQFFINGQIMPGWTFDYSQQAQDAVSFVLYGDGTDLATPSPANSNQGCVALGTTSGMPVVSPGLNVTLQLQAGLSFDAEISIDQLFGVDIGLGPFVQAYLDNVFAGACPQVSVTDFLGVALSFEVQKVNSVVLGPANIGFGQTPIFTGPTFDLCNVFTAPAGSLVQPPSPGGSPSPSPEVDTTTLTDADGRLETFGLDANGHMLQDIETGPGGQHWNGWQSLAGAGSLPPGGARELTGVYDSGSGHLMLFALGFDGQDYTSSETAPNSGVFGTWQLLASGGGTASNFYQLAAAENNDGRSELFGVDANGNVFQNWQTSPGGAWNGWEKLGVSQPEPLGTLSASYDPASRLIELFARGVNTGTDYKIQQSAPNAGSWSAWTSLGGNYGALTAVPNENGYNELFGTDANGDLWANTEASTGYQGWQRLVQGTEPPMFSLSAGYSPDAGVWVLFATDEHNAIWDVFQNGANNAGGNSGWCGFPGIVFCNTVAGPFVTHVASGSKLTSGTRLPNGSQLTATGANYSLTMRGSDGTLVLSDYFGHLRWWSGTTNYPNQGGYRAGLALQPGGDLVIYVGPRQLWHSATDGNAGDCAWLQNDGNFVIYKGGCTSYANPGNGLWATGTTRNAGAPSCSGTATQMAPGTTLHPGNVLCASGRQYEVKLSGGGLLVCQSANCATGRPQSFLYAPSSGADILVMQLDGNLVLYKDDTAVWSAGTKGTSNPCAWDQNDGNFVLYKGGCTSTAFAAGAVWSSATNFSPGQAPVSSTCNSPNSFAMSNGGTLYPGTMLCSYGGMYQVRFTSTSTGGGLLICSVDVCASGSNPGYGHWNVIAANSGADMLVDQPDGNLVLWKDDTEVWSTKTGGQPAGLVELQNDGNFVDYGTSDSTQVFWSPNTWQPPSGSTYSGGQDGNTILSGQTLESGHCMYSPNGTYELCDDPGGTYAGTLSLFRNGVLIWGVGGGLYGSILTQQPDGNHVLYHGPISGAVCSSGTNGNPGAYTSLQNDGNLVVYNTSGTAIWARTWPRSFC